MTIAIMQPTYLPWAGYFDLVDQGDLFVFLDTVQFEKQSWQQRNRIKTPSGALWLTVPCRQRLPQSITEVRIDPASKWRRKHWLSLSANYAHAPHWHVHRGALEAIYARDWDRLVDLNVAMITLMASLLGIAARFVRASEMSLESGDRTGRLVEICTRLGADTYLSPRGAFVYLESDRPFTDRGIRLRFQRFDTPEYRQSFGDFIPGLSAIDLLINEGPSALGLIRSARRPWLTFAELEVQAGAMTGAHG